MPVDIDLFQAGMRIRNIREKLGLTMEEFAKKIDSKAQKGTVSNWENGKNLPNKLRLQKIAELGNSSPEWILFGDIPITVKQLIDDIQKDEISKYNSELYKQLYDPKTKKEITDIILERYSFANLTPIGLKQFLKITLDKVLTEYKEMNEFMPYNNENALIYSKYHLLKLKLKVNKYFSDDTSIKEQSGRLEKEQLKDNLSYKLYNEIMDSLEDALKNLIDID